jgi:hypothetical protein
MEKSELVSEIKKALEKKRSKNPYPRMYLDTCVLVNILLESDTNWQQKYKPDAEKMAAIKASLTLYEHRQKLELSTSVFAIGEFIAQGRMSDFGNKSFDDMIEIVNNAILPDIKITYNDLSFKQTPKIDKRWGKYWLFAKLEASGQAVDDDGKAIGSISTSTTLDLVGGTASSWTGGVPNGKDIFQFNPQLTNIEVSSYSAPAFEIMLFSEATKTALDLGLKLPDAIHILSSRGRADMLVTNDKPLLQKYKKKQKWFGIRLISSPDMIAFLQKIGFL